MEKIAVIGIWHQGAVAAACLADLGYIVCGFDANLERIEKLNAGRAPLFEPGLDDLLSKGIRNKNLFFTPHIDQALIDTRDIIVAFDIPVDENDEVDLSEMFSTMREMAPHLLSDTLILVTAQIPIGTCDQIATLIRDINHNVDFGIAYCPENLRLGQAIERYKSPPLPVMGTDSIATFRRAEKLFAPLKVSWMKMDLRSAEMTKHALNVFFGVSICFANEIGNLCDEVGADGIQVAKGLKLEPRIGPQAMLLPGLGFSGGTLARDMRALQQLGDRVDCDTPVIDGAWIANIKQNHLVVQKMLRLFGSLKNLHIGILGLTYKPDTSTIRRSVSIEIIKEMASLGAVIKAFDPKADCRELSQHKEFKVYLDAYSAADGCDALVIVTPWPEFKQLNYERLQIIMRRPFIFDTQNLLDKELLIKIGFKYMGIGRGLKI